MNYHTGMLDQRVSLQRSTLVDDGAGGAAVSVVEYAEVWAYVHPMSGREREHAMRADSTANYLVVVRTRDDVLERDRIVWRGRTLNVRFARNKGPREEYLEIEAEMGAAS